MKVYLETMGCQMNRLDSELVLGALTAAGHEATDDRGAADVVLYNTCSVRQQAENKVLSRIGEDGLAKNDRPGLVIGVMGCMAQREGEKLRARYPFVDLVVGPGQLARLPELIAQAADGKAAVVTDPTRSEGRDETAETHMDALDLTRPTGADPTQSQAFVRVMRGCNNFCSYCIVPYVRGPERSRPPEAIVAEARKLVDAGRLEITLLGQTVNRYRYSETGRTVRFSDLLERVAAIDGLERLRFVTSYPTDFTEDILLAMRDLPNVCEYIHVPAQSGSDRMLCAMNRRYTRPQYDELIDRAREIVPGVVLAGDFIVGFPGETEADHQASIDLIRRTGYKNAFVFKYSPRPGTAAAKSLADSVPAKVKRRRNNELLTVQLEMGEVHHRGYVGRQLEVLVTGPSRRVDKQAVAPTARRMQLSARTRWDHIVVFDGPASLTGRLVRVKVTGSTSLTLFAELLGRE